MAKLLRYLFYGIFVLTPLWLSGQIDVDALERTYGKGELTLKKKISISFFFNETEKAWHAKVSHRYDKLYIGHQGGNGLVQVPFNKYQTVKLDRARFFKLDSLGEKVLIENVKVRYADTKDYFIENIFYNDLKVKQFQCEVDLPENYLVSYGYQAIYKDLKYLSSFYVQQPGEAVQEVEISVKKNAQVDVSLFDFNLTEEVKRTEDAESIKFSAKNLKRFEQNYSAVGGSYYLPHFILTVKSVKGAHHSPQLLTSTDAMYNWYHSLIEELAPDVPYIKKLTGTFIQAGMSDEDKVDAIFKWVQQNVQYIAFEDGIAGFKPTEAQEVGALKYGDCKGMANLLVNMLRAEGFDAHHAWIGTRSKNYSYKIPSLVVDNHMICALNFGGQRYYLDGTDKSAFWNSIPPHLMGKEVMVANKERYEIDTIPVCQPNQNKLEIKGKINLTAGSPQVVLEVSLQGYFSREFSSAMQYTSLDEQENIPFYFMRPYLKGLMVEKLSKPRFLPGETTFTITASGLDLAKSDRLLVFPFLNILPYQKLGDKDAPVYIDFPYVAEVELELVNGSNRCKDCIQAPEKIGTDKGYIQNSVEQNGNNVTIRQKLFVNMLNSQEITRTEWNELIRVGQSYNNFPLIYENN